MSELTIINSLSEPMEYKAGAGISDLFYRAGGGGVWQIEDVVLMHHHQSSSGPLSVLEFRHPGFCKVGLILMKGNYS